MANESAISLTEMERAQALLARVEQVFDQRVVGQRGLRTALVSSLISSGHVLLESVPGLAKTTAAQTLASAVSGSFHRIQCTPDLMPNDIVGTQIFNYTTGALTTQLGPVHANLVLLDEINRSSAKTQSAMLEAMQEQQTSIGGVVYPVPQPFMVMATQNPIEEEGTYVLPEAQMDRFLVKEVLTYPTPTEEVEILERLADGSLSAPLRTEPITLEDLRFLRGVANRVFVHRTIKEYVVAIINTTRGGGPRPLANFDEHVRVGASPRGGIALMRLGQALALMAGRTYVVPDDVKSLRHPVLRHRLVRTYDALANNVTPESLIDAVFAAVPVPLAVREPGVTAREPAGTAGPAGGAAGRRAARGAPPLHLRRPRPGLRRDGGVPSGRRSRGHRLEVLRPRRQADHPALPAGDQPLDGAGRGHGATRVHAHSHRRGEGQRRDPGGRGPRLPGAVAGGPGGARRRRQRAPPPGPAPPGHPAPRDAAAPPGRGHGAGIAAVGPVAGAHAGP